MADLTARIKPKKSSTAGEVPQAADLEVAELAVNTADGKLFVKHTDDSIKEISGGGGSVASLDDIGDVAYAQQLPLSTWTSPNTTNPEANEYRLYSSGIARLSTTSLTGYEKDNLLARLTLGANVVLEVNSVTHTGTVSIAASLSDAGTSTERVEAGFSVSPSLSDTTLSDTSLVLKYSDEPAGTIAPTDGQTLNWVGANNQWEPADPTNAVDSVNGQTGVVSLDVEDMNNVQDPVLGLLYDDKIIPEGSRAATAAGEYDPRSSNGVLLLSDIGADGTDHNAYLATWQSGDALSFYNGVDGSFIYSAAITGTINHSGGTIWFNLDDYSGWNAVIATTSLVVQNDTRPTSNVAIGAADGQVLTYVSTSGRWEPADAIGAVASVNGQTGVVSLGIQDMDDYKPQYESSGAPIGEWEFRGTQSLTGMCDRPGDAVTSVSNVQVAVTDLNGDDHTGALTALIGQTAWVEVAGVRAEVDFSGASYSAASCRFYWGDAGMPPIALGDRMKIWPAGVTPAAPTDGQVLTWVNGNSAWEPRDLQGAAVRAALGIGEYADDAAAGTGGVASGAMYYNTTSSDYRLKS